MTLHFDPWNPDHLKADQLLNHASKYGRFGARSRIEQEMVLTRSLQDSAMPVRDYALLAAIDRSQVDLVRPVLGSKVSGETIMEAITMMAAKRSPEILLPIDPLLKSAPLTPLPEGNPPWIRLLYKAGLRRDALALSDLRAGWQTRNDYEKNEFFHANQNRKNEMSTVIILGGCVLSTAGTLAVGMKAGALGLAGVAAFLVFQLGSETAINAHREGAMARILPYAAAAKPAPGSA